jgi:hypothetical protein
LKKSAAIMATPRPDLGEHGELAAARARLDRGTELLEQALELRDMLCWQIDIAAMKELVDDWKRRVRAHRGRS